MTKLLHIERLCYGVDAIARDDDGRAVFVAGGVPGDVCEVQITETKKSYAKAIITNVVEAGPARISPKCAACGGCPWSHVSYEAQVEAKTANVADALVRTGHLDAARVAELVQPCIPSPNEWGYRNKIELAVRRGADGRPEIGMSMAGSHDLAAIDVCPLAVASMQKAPKGLRGSIRYLSGNTDLGLFRIGMRASTRTKDVEIALWTTPGTFPRAQAAKILREAFPSATSIVRVIADEGSARTVKQVEQLWGKGCWAENLAGAKFQTSAPSFFQVNTPQAEVLVQTVLAGLGGPETLSGAYVADLYSGGGTFTIPLAQAGADVVAVESAGTSVRDLRRNAEKNDVADCIEVIGGDSARELPELGELDALVVDPPRAGLAPGVPESIAEAGPERVAYVSCDPATLARDVAKLETLGYKAQLVQPVDLFPQTYHVENVCILTKTGR